MNSCSLMTRFLLLEEITEDLFKLSINQLKPLRLTPQVILSKFYLQVPPMGIRRL